MLVERSAFSTSVGEISDTSKIKQKTTKRGGRTPKHRTSKAYAQQHGINRGSNKKTDAPPMGEQPPLDLDATDEGLLTFVQSTSCRRKLLANAFDIPEALLKGSI